MKMKLWADGPGVIWNPFHTLAGLNTLTSPTRIVTRSPEAGVGAITSESAQATASKSPGTADLRAMKASIYRRGQKKFRINTRLGRKGGDGSDNLRRIRVVKATESGCGGLTAANGYNCLPGVPALNTLHL